MNRYLRSLYVLTFASAAGFATAQPADVRQGLVAYWPLESTDGGIANDATAFANQLTVSGSPLAGAGVRGNAFTFDGASTYLANSHTEDNTPTGLPVYRAGSYTIAMWVRGDAQTGKYLFSHGNTTVNTPIFILQTGQTTANNAKFDVIIRNDANATLLNHVVSTNVVYDGEWHHIAWVDSNGSVQLYIDGVQDPANFNYTPAGTFTFNNTVIGSLIRTTISTGAIFNGQMDDIAVWERALTQSEVQQVMNAAMTTPVPEFPPYIERQPAGITARIGDQVTLTARAIGNRPLSFQWFSNDVAVVDATTPSLSLSKLTVADSATYTVQISNGAGTVTSEPAVVTVLPDAPADLRNGLVSHWPLNEVIDDFPALLTADLYSHNDFTLFNMSGANNVFGQVDNALSFDGASQYAQRTGGGFPAYDNPAYSIAMWININGVGQSDRRFFAESSTNSDTPLFVFGTHATGVDGRIRVYIRSSANTVLVDRYTTNQPLDGTWHHLVWTETNGQARLYIDGELDPASFSYTRSALALNQTALGAIVRGTVAAHCAGTLDEVAVWHRVLSYTEIQEIRASGIPAPVMAIAPSITQQPQGQSVLTRSRVTLSVTATGTSPLDAQWRKDGQALDNETGLTLVIGSAQLDDAGDYDVIISNSAGSVTSQVATVSVSVRPEPPTSLRIDFNNSANDDAGNTEVGFQSFSLPSIGLGPFSRSYGGAEVSLTGVGVSLESRLRGTPANNGLFTEERLLRDFVFARDTTPETGIDIAVQFLEPNTSYAVTLWSFDTGSTGARVSDWSANGTGVVTGYTFDGATLPADNLVSRITFDATTDGDGTILIQGRRSAATSGVFNVFLNALQVVRRELRLTSITLLPGGLDIELMVEVLDPSVNHRLFYKDNLNDPEWLEETNAFFLLPEGNTIRVLVTRPEGATRFYQVVQDQ